LFTTSVTDCKISATIKRLIIKLEIPIPISAEFLLSFSVEMLGMNPYFNALVSFLTYEMAKVKKAGFSIYLLFTL
jgi:hypothetical protein